LKYNWYSRFERKGKTVPNTSANGHMFSLLNKAGEIGIRFSKELQKKYIKEWDTTVFNPHYSYEMNNLKINH
jgi:hypothetical protein